MRIYFNQIQYSLNWKNTYESSVFSTTAALHFTDKYLYLTKKIIKSFIYKTYRYAYFSPFNKNIASSENLYKILFYCPVGK